MEKHIAGMKRINPYKQFIGSFIPEWLEERSEISPGAKICYARLARFAGKDGSCYPKRDTIAKSIGISERQVDRYIKELKNQGLIDVRQLGLGRNNEYIFYWHEWMDGYYKDKTDVADQDVTDMAGQESTDMSSLRSTDVASPYIRESYKENHLRDTIHRFEEFWDLYDKKLERRKCENKWKKLSSDDKESIMQFNPIYKQSVSSKQYLKHPFTFLNSRIWEDDWNNYKAHETHQPTNEPTRTDTFAQRGEELLNALQEQQQHPDRYNSWQLEGKRTDPYSTS